MKFHLNVKIESEIERIIKGEGTVLEGNIGEVWNILQKAKQEGKIYRSGCNNMNQNGTCGGHK